MNITSPKENSEVEGPNITISGVSDPNAKVTVSVSRVPEGAAAKAAVTNPQQETDADDEGNWSVTVAGVESGKYTAHAADGLTEDTTTFFVVDPSVGSDSSATEGGSDSSATEGASDTSSTETDASTGGKDEDSPSKPESGGNKDELADTGANGVLIAAGAALILALAGAGVLFARRKKA
ncbi:LPXTG cell wall anchor domain-containing protein [Glutamicibacter creatinolyticus]|uniref:LPXTG cell wall anchor domain-containing protein n=1 Tax=Glutamicibacter creatinolyticus TaxID=162496 RepID=UPI001110CA73|nr:LPXTG cell wall anchor domain-containing protein [Glutamicibacter creatinolyticus]